MVKAFRARFIKKQSTKVIGNNCTLRGKHSPLAVGPVCDVEHPHLLLMYPAGKRCKVKAAGKEIFLQMLQKDHSGNKDPQERSWQCPSSQGGKAGRALRGSRCCPTALARGSAKHPPSYWMLCSGQENIVYKQRLLCSGCTD